MPARRSREPHQRSALDQFGVRASSHKFTANRLRLLFAALAGTELVRASAATIRMRLIKIDAAIVRNTRCVRVLLVSHHPLREVFLSAARALVPKS